MFATRPTNVSLTAHTASTFSTNSRSIASITPPSSPGHTEKSSTQ